jgi:hypothetical protein
VDLPEEMPPAARIAVGIAGPPPAAALAFGSGAPHLARGAVAGPDAHPIAVTCGFIASPGAEAVRRAVSGMMRCAPPCGSRRSWQRHATASVPVRRISPRESRSMRCGSSALRGQPQPRIQR